MTLLQKSCIFTFFEKLNGKKKYKLITFFNLYKCLLYLSLILYSLYTYLNLKLSDIITITNMIITFKDLINENCIGNGERNKICLVNFQLS